jgi:hypothetical protein
LVEWEHEILAEIRHHHGMRDQQYPAGGAACGAPRAGSRWAVAATVEERAHRKRRLIKGPREFRDVRGDQPKKKS